MSFSGQCCWCALYICVIDQYTIADDEIACQHENMSSLYNKVTNHVVVDVYFLKAASWFREKYCQP